LPPLRLLRGWAHKVARDDGGDAIAICRARFHSTMGEIDDGAACSVRVSMFRILPHLRTKKKSRFIT
jgi:hypothetical protein